MKIEGGDVFVSYASQDIRLAEDLVAILEQSGISCWIAPRNVTPGVHYADEIIRGITECKVLVLILSGSAIASKHVGKEVERAASKGRPIIAIRTDASALTPGLEYFLSESQWVEVGASGLEPVSSKIIAAIRHQTGASAGHELGRRSNVATPAAAISGRRWVPVLVSGAVVLVLAGLSVSWLWFARHTPPTTTVSGSVASSTATSAAVPDKSIAVLPFVDMSEKKDQEYFADGMAEEILDLLAKVPGIIVISRTSSFQFKGKVEDLRAIGTQLGVANVLEGSVRRSGDRLRVTAQLIDARTGTRRWSESYDRDAEDVLKVQSEIALALVRALQVTVGAEEWQSVSSTTNLAAYTLYLQGRHAFDRFDAEGFESAQSYLQQAIAIDPRFARAWGVLAAVHLMKAWYGFAPRAESFERGRELTRRAMALDPSIPEGHAMLALISTIYDSDWVIARREMDQSLSQYPNNPITLLVAGQFEGSQGNWDAASAYMTRSIAVDPLEASTLITYGSIEYRAGRLDRAESLIRRGLAISPTYVSGAFTLAKVLLARGQFAAALAAAEREEPEGGREAGRAIALRALGRERDSKVALADFVAKMGAETPFTVAQVYAFRGERDAAFLWLNRALREHDPDLHTIKGEPLFDNLKSDPRFGEFLRTLKLPE